MINDESLVSFGYDTENLLSRLRYAANKLEFRKIINECLAQANTADYKSHVLYRNDLHFIKEGIDGHWFSITTSDALYTYYSALQKRVELITFSLE